MRDVRGDDAALRPLRQGRADHLDLGAEGGRPSAAQNCFRRPPKSISSGSCTREGRLRALSERAVGAAGRQPPARRRARRPRHHRDLGAADGRLRVRPHGQGDLDVVDRLRRRPGRDGGGARARVGHRDVLADQRRRPADLRVVAEPHHHLRADDARRDRRHRRSRWSSPRASAAAAASCTTRKCPTARSWWASRTRRRPPSAICGPRSAPRQARKSRRCRTPGFGLTGLETGASKPEAWSPKPGARSLSSSKSARRTRPAAPLACPPTTRSPGSRWP